jgi:hypothetical protein
MDRGSIKSIVGAIISCSSIIGYSQYLFESGAEKFYPSHCINNATENLFAQVSLKSSKPTADDFKEILKGYSISGLESKCNSNYKFEDETKLNSNSNPFVLAKELIRGEFIGDSKQEFAELVVLDLSNCKTDDELYQDNFHFISFHKNIILFINSNINLLSGCDICMEALQPVPVDPHHSCLSTTSRSFFSALEHCFRELQKKLPLNHPQFKANFVQNSMSLAIFDHCLNIQAALIDKFYDFRLSEKIPNVEKHRALKFASKSLSN